MMRDDTTTDPAVGEFMGGLLSGVSSEAARRLIVAAVEAFAERGYYATTTRDISAAAGMSPAAMYIHYSSKEAILFAATRIAHDAAQATITRPVLPTESIEERVRAIVRDFTRWHADGAPLARVAQYQREALSVEHQAVIAAIRRRTETLMRTEIEAGVRAGVFHPRDVGSAARAILSMGIDVVRWFRPGGRMGAAELADQYAELALRMLGVPPSTDAPA